MPPVVEKKLLILSSCYTSGCTCPNADVQTGNDTDITNKNMTNSFGALKYYCKSRYEKLYEVNTSGNEEYYCSLTFF